MVARLAEGPLGASDGGPLPRFALASDGMPVATAFELWRETISPIFDVGIDGDGGLDDFSIAFEAFQFGPLMLGRTRGRGNQTFDRTQPTVARSNVDHILLHAYLHGGNRVSAEGAEFSVEAGDVWLFDMARTVRSAAREFSLISVAVPRALLEPLVDEADGLHGVKISGDTVLGGILFDHIRSLEARADEMTRPEARLVADSTVRLVAGCVAPTMRTLDAARADLESAFVARIRRDIEARLADPDLGPDLLARRHGVSRAGLYRLFESFGGVADYIRRRRLKRAFVDLGTPALRDLRIVDVAHRCGFGSEAAFTRAFRARFGLTPSDVRRLGPEGLAAAFADEPGPLPPDQWMLTRLSR